MVKTFIKDNAKKIIILSVIFVVFLIFILYNNIPRISYSYDKDEDSYIVSEVFGNAREYSIKSTHKGKKVTVIGKRAFLNKTSLRRLNFSKDNNVMYIESGAFDGCKNLKSITIPKEITYVEDNVFSKCSKLTKVEFEEGSNLKVIGGSMFLNCYKLKEITLPNKINQIGTFAFFNCKSLEKMIIPKSVETIYNDVFYNCSSLKDIVINNEETVLNDEWLGNLNKDNLNIVINN